MNREKVVPELLVEKDALVGEASIWHVDEQVLYWVDILSHELYV